MKRLLRGSQQLRCWYRSLGMAPKCLCDALSCFGEGRMDKKMEKQVRTLIEEVELLAGSFRKIRNDDTSMRTSRTLTRMAIRLESLLSAIEHVQKQIILAQ
jgi:hypothetical protein